MRSDTSLRAEPPRVPPMAPSKQNFAPSIPNSPKGFDKQYKDLFRAFEKAENPNKKYKDENGQTVFERFGTFAIPEEGPQARQTRTIAEARWCCEMLDAKDLHCEKTSGTTLRRR